MLQKGATSAREFRRSLDSNALTVEALNNFSPCENQVIYRMKECLNWRLKGARMASGYEFAAKSRITDPPTVSSGSSSCNLARST